jgi:hypothetical protein
VIADNRQVSSTCERKANIRRRQGAKQMLSFKDCRHKLANSSEKGSKNEKLFSVITKIYTLKDYDPCQSRCLAAE